MSHFKRLIKYTEVVLDDFSNSKEIISYCIPIKVNRFENGSIENYEVEQIFEVAEYILGNEAVLKRKICFTPNKVPKEVEIRMLAIEQGLRNF